MHNCSRRKTAIILLLLAALLAVIFPERALAWGATTRTPGVCTTHQSIIKEAYKLLEEDPAYKGSRFPKPEEILEHEGMQWVTSLTWDFISSSQYDLVGPGPDDETKTKWSEHFYNPETGKGGAPAAAEKYFTELCDALYRAESNKQADAGKGAAWSAHFLADMYVPYHIVGIPGDEAKAMDKNGNYLLDEKKSGPAYLYGLPDDNDLPPKGWGGGQNFTNAIRRFVKYANDVGPQAQRDWCDPWYLNGWWIGDAKFLKSSHVNYEVLAYQKFQKWAVYPLIIVKYTEPFRVNRDTEIPAWLNKLPSWDKSISNQAAVAEDYAKAAAKVTRNNMKRFWEKPEDALYAAIDSAYTLWRASISALKPQAKVTLISANRYQVAGTIGNVADEVAREVEARLTISGGRIIGKNTQPIEPVGKEPKPVVWEIESADIKQCKIRMEVIGYFEHTPDLQYAFTDLVAGTVASTPAAPPKTTPTPTPTKTTPAPAATGRPIITNLKGPEQGVVDYAGNLFTIWVKGGKEPYSYEWGGNKTEYTETRGGNSIQVVFKSSQFKRDGDVYSMWVSVKDANGQYASWTGSNSGPGIRFTWSIKYIPGKKDASGKWITQPSWVVNTEPKFPYQTP